MTQVSINPFEIIEHRLSSIESKIDDLKALNRENAIIPEPSEDIGGIQLAEKTIGLAKPTIYALVAQSKIPYMKRGKHLYFSKKELTDWIKSGRKKTLVEKELESAGLKKTNKRKI
jgi:excisionase family DNA binding protein